MFVAMPPPYTATVRDLGGQIALVDVLALEAIRVFSAGRAPPDAPICRGTYHDLWGLDTPLGATTQGAGRPIDRGCGRC